MITSVLKRALFIKEGMNMLNKLYLEMIKYDSCDPKRIQHFTKVHSYAKLIGENEGLDKEALFILEAAALCHDIGIHVCEKKYGNCRGDLQEKEGPLIAKDMLNKLGFMPNVIDRVCYLIGHHHTYTDIDGLDYQILLEADFLVNLYEDGVNKEAIEHAYNHIFKTNTGKLIMKDMFGLK